MIRRLPRLGALRHVARYSYKPQYDYSKQYDPSLNEPPQSQFQQYRNQQYHNVHNPPRPRWFRNFLLVMFGTSALSAFAYYMWWPKHTFPSLVAKILRKGLWAESDKGENDYELALKYYLEALDHCDEIGLDNLSDEYTGIQLKVAEMFERLNRIDEAQFIYNEISTLYLSVLSAKPGLPEFKRIRNPDHRYHLIQKDLRIAVKLVEHQGANPHLSKAILTTHLLLAFDEIRRKIEAYAEGEGVTLKTPGNTLAKSPHLYTDFGNIVLHTPENLPAGILSPFCDELLNVMDIFQAVCVSAGDLDDAININMKMIEYMLINKEPYYKFVRTYCTTGSLFYLGAEEFEVQEIKLRQKLTNQLGVDIANLKLIPIQKDRLEFKYEHPDSSVTDKFVELVKNHDPDISKLIEVIANRTRFTNLAIHSYQVALAPSKLNPRLALPPNENDISEEEQANLAVARELMALATYGLGVTHLHLGDYEAAERFLREARVKCKGCGYEELQPEIERELGKVFEERDGVTRVPDTSDVDIDVRITR